MPSSNSLGNLEVNDSFLSAPLAAKLNDRMRRIGDAISTLQKTVASLPVSATTTGGSSGGGDSSVSQIVLAVPGILGIQSDAAPVLTLGASQSFSTLEILLKIAPTGENVTIQLYVGGSPWGAPLSASGTSASISVSGAGAIAANSLIQLDITGVGTTFPGSDLTVILR